MARQSSYGSLGTTQEPRDHRLPGEVQLVLVTDVLVKLQQPLVLEGVSWWIGNAQPVIEDPGSGRRQVAILEKLRDRTQASGIDDVKLTTEVERVAYRATADGRQPRA